MTAVADAQPFDYDAPQKDLYEVGEIPPIGHLPKQMYAWAIRRERHGPPEQSMQLEVVDTPEPDSHEVVVLVMAAGVNYNGVWAGLGEPISPFDVHKAPFHIAGSDASGIVWKVGSKVKRWKVGDEVVIHCNQDDGDDEHCNGGDPMYSPSQRIWGYETPDGSFAQFTCVQAQQLMHRPKHLSWRRARATRSRWPPPIGCCSAIARMFCSRARTCWFGAPRGAWAPTPSSSSTPPAPTRSG